MNSLGGSRGYRGASGHNLRGNAAGAFQGDIIPEGYQAGQIQQYNPQQMKLHEQQFSHVAPDSYLSKLASGDQDLFNEIEAPAHRQFQEQIGGLATRFSNMGTGARRGSGFQNASTQAASNFAQDLQAQRLGMRNQALQELMQYSNMILGQRPQERFLSEKPPKDEGLDWMGLGGAALGGVGGFLAGGPAGALSGASLGYGIGSGKGGGSLSGFTSTGWR